MGNAPPPDRIPEKEASRNSCLVGGGKMGALMRSFDWSKTAVGEVNTWPISLQTAVNIVLNSAFPMFVWWDKKHLTNFYNDSYKEILGKKHPAALGRPAKEAWAEIWDEVGPLAEQVFRTGKPVYKRNLRLLMNRHGYEEETYFTFSYSPLRDEVGAIAGLFCAVTETTDEVLSLQRLQESEERFRNLADTSPMYIAMADDSGNAVYFNKPWLKFTGKKLKDMLGLGWLSTLHPEDASKFEEDFKHAFSKQIPISKEYRFKRSDGKYRWMLAQGAPRFTPDGHFMGYFGTYTDFHELKQAQLALQESEERFRTLIEKSADAVQLVSAEGKIIFSSDSIKNVLGYTPEELADEGVTPFIHPDDKDYFFTQLNNLLMHPDEQVTLQYRVKHKDGSWAWLETVGVNHLNTPNIHALVGNFRNITKQKHAEEKLKRSEERFRALAENIPNLAWMAKPDGYIYWYNTRWFAYTGTTSEQMEGWGWQSVHDPDLLPKVLKKWKRSIRSGKTFEMVFPIRGADGKFRPFLTRSIPVFADNGKIMQWIGTNTDISEQIRIKEVEARTEELEKIAAQLALQRKQLLELNNAKDEFISLASHQLRTPATGVKQYIGMILEGYAGELSPKQKEFLEQAYESNEREITIINDLLHVAQVDAGKMRLKKQELDFVSFMQSILDEQAHKFLAKQQKLHYIHPPTTLTAKVDGDRMRMALENLIDNANKYSGNGTTITITLASNANGSLMIEIKDEGVGIERKDRIRIFDKFARTENSLSGSVDGSGLGLYLVKKIIGLHGGTIRLKSKLGTGTSFIIELPI